MISIIPQRDRTFYYILPKDKINGDFLSNYLDELRNVPCSENHIL